MQCSGICISFQRYVRRSGHKAPPSCSKLNPCLSYTLLTSCTGWTDVPQKELDDKQRRLVRFENVQDLMQTYKKPLLQSAFDLQSRLANQVRQDTGSTYCTSTCVRACHTVLCSSLPYCVPACLTVLQPPITKSNIATACGSLGSASQVQFTTVSVYEFLSQCHARPLCTPPPPTCAPQPHPLTR